MAEVVEVVEVCVADVEPRPKREALRISGMPVDELWRLYGLSQIAPVSAAAVELWGARAQPTDNILRPLTVDGVTLTAAEIAGELARGGWHEAAWIWVQLYQRHQRCAAISLMCRVAVGA
jgi:hypothetical protein